MYFLMPSLISYFKNTVDVVLRGGFRRLIPVPEAAIRLTVLHLVAEATQLLHRQLVEHLQIPRMKIALGLSRCSSLT